jgi:DNA-binding beta-propeller fold protein YncE
MVRHARTEPRPPQHARFLPLLLAVLFPVDFVRIASAAPPPLPPPPVFERSFTSPGMCSPRGVGVSPSGQVFVGSDCEDPHMAIFTVEGVPTGTWGLATFLGPPNGVAVDGSGNVFVTDYERNRVHKFTSGGALNLRWAPGQYFQPVDIAVNSLGEVFVLELGGRRVQKFTNSGSLLATIGSAGTGPGQFESPKGLGLDPGGRLYVADGARLRVLRFLANGSFDMEFATPVSPTDVAVGPDGRVYIVSFDAYNALQYSSAGTLLQTFTSPSGLNEAFRIAISSTGGMYITEQMNHWITQFQIDQTTDARRTTFGGLKAMYR